MRKSCLTLFGFAILLLVAIQGHAQPAKQPQAVAEREAEWNQFVLPQSTFVRLTDPDKVVLFKVPSEWKQTDPGKLNFFGPHGATLSVFVQKIPDGVPLRDYVASMMQPLRSLPEGADSLVVRRTTMSALEAREIMFETNAETEELNRRIIWTTVRGPNALSFILFEPSDKLAEIEPSFKAIVQSVVLLDDKLDYAGFDALRSSAVKDIKPARVDEVQALADSFATLDGSSRAANINKLANVFASSPDTALDLALDGRAMVRAAAIEAIVQSRNRALDKFLLRALNDPEAFVAQKAARSVAADPNVFSLLREHSFEWLNIEPVARVWPLLNRKTQIKILTEIFAQPLVPAPAATAPSPASSPGKPRVLVQANVLPPGSSPVFRQGLTATSDPSRQLNALTLMRDLPAAEFKLPFTALLAAKHDKLTTLALQVAWGREELLPVAELLRLLSSANSEVRRLAALHLGQSGSTADIKIIQEFIDKSVPSSPSSQASPSISPAPPASVVVIDSKPVDDGPTLSENLQVTINKIRLREQLATASGDARQQLIKKSLADPKLAEWVWYRFVKQNSDGDRAAVELKSSPVRQLKVLPLGENIFPNEVTYFAALPKPAVALDKFSGALAGLQLESARSQATLVLILSAMQEQLALQLDSPPGAASLPFSGINTNEPVALASWYAEGAPRGVRSAERKAIVLRVTDRARFERTLTLYQHGIGNFHGLPDYFSGGIRMITVLPAFLSLTAKAILEVSADRKSETPFLKYSLIEESEWNGYPVKAIEERSVDSTGHVLRDVAYLTYVNDTAVLAPDLDSLRDVLTRLSSEKETLATNASFKQLTATSGEAIYLSNFTELAAGLSGKAISPSDGVVRESGSLNISNSTWENLYQVSFSERDWLKPFIGFHPEELKSPRELLPRTTMAYYFMNFDAVAGWRDWSQLLDADTLKEVKSIWAVDFEKQVLPELGPECGVALLGLPDILNSKKEPPWAAFFKLKSDKLARALADGKLLQGGVVSAGREPTQLKLKSGTELFVIVKGDFIVVANSRAGISALEQPDKLINSRDFARAAKRSPAGVVAFGGYNLDAAISSLGDAGTDSVRTQQSALIASLVNAFHSPNFYATATADAVQGRFSLSLDREGRFSVSELASLSKDFRLTYAQLEPRGIPVQNQERLSSLKLRIRATAAGEIDRIKEDVSSPFQTAVKLSDQELDLKILARHSEPKTSLTLPIKGAEFTPYLQATSETPSDDKSVTEKARSIAGDEKDAWKVARMLADWTYKNIKWKRVDYATTPQTLATLEADCLEFSQLYVAMARSLGLPARIVTGMAYSGSAFGGHAWVEVYVGEWIEVDPTWGTDFVDATHIRDSAKGALMTYAALNLIQLEVLEAPRDVAEFQKDPRALAMKLSQELPKGSTAALTSALDLAVLTNEQAGAGTWESFSAAERELMSSAYRRVLLEIGSGYKEEEPGVHDWRLLQVKQAGDRAEAVAVEPSYDGGLLKLSFVQRNDAWLLTELLQADVDFHVIAEILQPTIKSILDRRSNATAPRSTSAFIRVLLAMNKDPKAAIPIADRALKDDPKNQGLRHLKALALAQVEEKQADAIRLWEELANEKEPLAAALLNLAREHVDPDDAEKTKQAIAFYLRYSELVPEDPRAHSALADLYAEVNDDAHAREQHRAAIRSDPANTDHYVDFAAFLAGRKLFREAQSALEEADKVAKPDDDFFGDLMTQLYLSYDKTLPDELARTQPARMAKSAVANLYLGYVRMEDGHNLQALPLLKLAAALKKDWTEPHDAMARAYRSMKNWPAALNAADTAIKIDPEDSDAYFQRACALGRLGRTKESLKSFQKALEIDPALPELQADDDDLKALARRPEFKKLLAARPDPDSPADPAVPEPKE